MPHFDIIRQSKPEKSFRVASVMGSFDLQDNSIKERFTGDINLDDDWQIGLIVGNSGTGKTTIARELFPDAYITQYDYTHESILDDMPKEASMQDITKVFTSVGFSSVPSWLKSYAVLSNGEKMRVDLARAILENKELIVFDEFTSVVDRNVAKVGSFTIQKAIRKTKKRFIAVTCHFDVEDWLLPDWVFDTNSMTFRKCEGQKKNRPKCELKFYETKEKDYYWNIFGKYHYLSHIHHKGAKVFIATLNDELCAFASVLPFPHPRKKNFYKEHRIVVFPDYQGIGIARNFTYFICDLLKKEHKGWITTTSNPMRIESLKRDANFKCTRIGRTSTGAGKIQNKFIKGSTSSARITASFEYIG